MKFMKHLLFFYLGLFSKNVSICSILKFPIFFNFKNKNNLKSSNDNYLVKSKSINIFNVIKKSKNKNKEKLKSFINTYFSNVNLNKEKKRRKRKYILIIKKSSNREEDPLSEKKIIKHGNKIKTTDLDKNHDYYLNLMEFGDLSFFYGTNSDRNFYFYESIINRIKENKNNFITINNSYDEKKEKETVIDNNYIRVRGRIEKKIKQSKRIFLYLRQDYGLYVTCIYEKKFNNENVDDMYIYIKNLKNESVVDIIGTIKLHGNLKKMDVPYLESLYNQKSLEIIISHVCCISESFYDVPIIINENNFLNEKEHILNLNYESKQVQDGNADSEKVQVKEEAKKIGTNYNIPKEDASTYNKTKENTTEENNITRENKIGKNNIYNCENKSDDLFISSSEKINTNENILKLHNFCLNYRNSINHVIFNIKNNVSRTLRNILFKDSYIEVFTPKLMKINKKNKDNNSITNNINRESGVEFHEMEMDNENENRKNKKEEKNFIELNGSEGGCNCYKIEKENLLLAQSPQFYKQMLINSDFEKIFEMNYSYRNEKFHTSRHLNEFISLDMEQVIYDNYYEIIVYMYNLLKQVNDYINQSFLQELNLINLVHANKKVPFEASKICKNPIVLSFCEAHELLNKYYAKKNESDNYVYNSVYKKYIKILNNEEKYQLKKRIAFESCENNKLHNVYYYHKIVKKYKINLKDKNNNKRENSSFNVYKFLNNLNKDELYRSILLFFNKIYENAFSKNCNSNSSNCSTENETDEKCNYVHDNVNLITCDHSNIGNGYSDLYNNNRSSSNNNNTYNSCNQCYAVDKEEKKDSKTEICNYDFISLLNNFQEKKIYVNQTLKHKIMKDKYIFYDDFTNDQLNYLYLFLKYNFGTDLFIIDQYPIYLRPYYSLSNMYDLRFTNSFDFIFKGIEIISGSQRVHNLPILLFRALKENKNVDISEYLNKKNFKVLDYLNYFQNLVNKNSTIHKYFNSFQFSSKPHGGLALGFERYLMAALNLKNIKNTIFYD